MKLRKLLDRSATEPEILVTAANEADLDSIGERILRVFNDKLSFETARGTVLVRTSDIASVEVCGNYCDIHTLDETASDFHSPLTVRFSLVKIQPLLGPDFIQISRYSLVNFIHLLSVEADLVSGMVAVVGSSANRAQRIPISRRYLKFIYEKIGENHA